MLLTGVIFLPMVFALFVAFWRSEKTVRSLAFGLSIIEFLLSLAILVRYDPSTPALQLVERVPWIERFGVSYFVGVDGISIWLVILTTFLTSITILGSWKSIDKKVRGFHAAIFLLQSAMLGTFLAMDAVLFYVFWELSLVPMYFMIGIWGGPRKIYATLKLFVYTMFGSVLMLVAIIYMMFLTQETTGSMSASLIDFYKLDLPFVGGQFFTLQTLLFFAFSIAFAIKVPIWPLHTWLPDAHTEAPTPGSVILAGVMLKMGTYGFLRWALPVFPEAAEHYAWLFMLVGVIGIIYGALVAMVQPDIKKLVAYSSVSHMGYVMLGLFSLNELGVTGGLYQMLNHGISTGALFLLVGMIYERTHSREIEKYGGLAGVLPKFSIAFFIITISAIAVPLTNGFIGEFLILMGAYQADRAFGTIAIVGVILGAVYMLWMYKRFFFGPKGPLVQDEKHPLLDLSARELAVMVPLIIMVFWMGIFPNHFLKYSKSSIDHFIQNKSNYTLPVSGVVENSKEGEN